MKELTDNGFYRFLGKRLGEKLPGLDGHRIMAPLVGEEFYRKYFPDEKTTDSAVLVLLIPEGNDFSLLLTLRSNKLENHKGQISFAGGRSEPGETPTQTALREANEETGIEPDKVLIAGELTELYVPPTLTMIKPVIGFMAEKMPLIINRTEVESAFYVSLNFLCDSNNVLREKWLLGSKYVDVPCWDVEQKTRLWGATAMILSELIVIYEEYKNATN